MVEGKQALGRGNRQAGPDWRGGPVLLGQRTAGRGERCWAVGFGPKGEGNAGLLGCLGWFGSGWGFVFSFLFFFFYFLFFCKLTQTSLNSNKLEFKLPSTQPK